MAGSSSFAFACVLVALMVIGGATVDAQFVPFTKCGAEYSLPLSHSAPSFQRAISALVAEDLAPMTLCAVSFRLQLSTSDPLKAGADSVKLEVTTLRDNTLLEGDRLFFVAMLPDGQQTVIEPTSMGFSNKLYAAPAGATAINVLLFSGSSAGQRIVNLSSYSATVDVCAEADSPLCHNGGTCVSMRPAMGTAWKEHYRCTCSEHYTGHQCQYTKNYCSYTAPDGSFYDLTNQMELVMTSYHGSYFRGESGVVQFSFCSPVMLYPCLEPPAQSAFCSARLPFGKADAWARARWQQLDPKSANPGLKITFFESDASLKPMELKLHCQSPPASSSVQKVSTQGLGLEGPLILTHADGRNFTLNYYPGSKQLSEVNAMHYPMPGVPYDYFCSLGKNPCLSNPCKNGGTCWVSYDKTAKSPILSAKCACPVGHSGQYCEL